MLAPPKYFTQKQVSIFIFGFVTMLLLLFHFYGMQKIFSLFGVGIMIPSFGDLRSVTTAADAYREGLNPFISNPYDPWNRPFNYPVLWKLFFFIPAVTESNSSTLGFVLFFVFFFSIAFFIKRINKHGLVALFLVLLSPSTMLALERGNVDILIFFFMALMITSTSIIRSMLLLFFGIAFKLFPLFASLILIFKWAKKKLPIAIFFALVALYILCMHQDIIRVAQKTQYGTIYSYGSFTFISLLNRLLNSFGYHIYGLYGSIIVAAIIFGTCCLALSFHKTHGIVYQNTWIYHSFIVGSSIFCGTFLLKSNWSYRLIFLIFTIPLLSELLIEKKNRLLALTAITLTILTTWANWIYFTKSFTLRIVLSVANELVKLSLLSTLTYLLALLLISLYYTRETTTDS